MIRIVANYCRLLITLVIGVLIVRLLLGKGDTVFSVYAFLIFGLGVGQLVREAVRISILPSLHSALSTAPDSPEVFAGARGFVALSGFASFGLFLVVFALVGAYVDNFGGVDYWWLAVLARFLVSLAMLGLLDLQLVAVHNADYIKFNSIILSERLVELFSVAVAVRAVSGDFFLVYALSLGLLSLVLTLVGRWYRSGAAAGLSGRYCLRDGLDFFRSNKKAVWSGFSLVLTNSIHYRLMIVIAGLYAGAGVSAAIAFSSQMVGYIRQVVVGLTSGLDSVLGVAKHGDRNPNRIVFRQFFLAGLVVLSISLIWIVFQKELFSLAGMTAESGAYIQSVQLFQYFVVAVLIRSCGEVLVSHLVSQGIASRLSSVSFGFSLLLPVYMLLCLFFGFDTDLLGYVYVLIAAVVYLFWLPYLCRLIIPFHYTFGFILIAISVVVLSIRMS